jgi:hypothetical protein
MEDRGCQKKSSTKCLRTKVKWRRAFLCFQKSLGWLFSQSIILLTDSWFFILFYSIFIKKIIAKILLSKWWDLNSISKWWNLNLAVRDKFIPVSLFLTLIFKNKIIYKWFHSRISTLKAIGRPSWLPGPFPRSGTAGTSRLEFWTQYCPRPNNSEPMVRVQRTWGPADDQSCAPGPGPWSLCNSPTRTEHLFPTPTV